MKIKLKGLTKVLKHLDNIKINVEKMAKDILEQLANIGVRQAKILYENAVYDGNSNVYVYWVYSNLLKVQVVATGEAVMFIEFGSGIKRNVGITNPLRDTTKPTVGAIGSYGRKQGATGKRWFYNNVLPKNPTSDYKGPGDTITYFETRKTSYGSITRQRTRVLTSCSTKGNQPARAMYGADMVMRVQIENVVKGVINKYVRYWKRSI